MEINEIKKIIESLLFVSDRPLLTREIKHIVKEDLPENSNLEDIIKELQLEYQQLNRAYELKFVADGWTFATKPEYAPWIKILLKDKTTLKLSPSAMEVLAIIAYKQPVTKTEIEQIRGVKSDFAVNKLVEYQLVCEVGRLDTPGRPILFGTTEEFLRRFGVDNADSLPIINQEMIDEFKNEAEEEVTLKSND